MAYCTQCGANNPASENFCCDCGQPIYPAPPQLAPAPAKKRSPVWLALAVVCLIAAGWGGYYLYNSGSGTITLQNGSIYTGPYKNRQPDGHGTLKQPDGATYVGSFSKGKFSGDGTLTLPDGTKYTGQFADGKYHGQGILEAPKQWTLAGAFQNGKAEGQATKTFSDGTVLHCNFLGGMPHGLATIIRPNEPVIYEQNYVNGEKAGGQIAKPPFTIRDVVLSNTQKDKTLIQDKSSQFAQGSIRYITCRLEVVSLFPRAVEGELQMIYRKPNGEIERNTATSPPGGTMTSKLSLANEGATQVIHQGWGSEKGGTFQKGRYKIEFVWKNIKVHETTFEVI